MMMASQDERAAAARKKQKEKRQAEAARTSETERLAAEKKAKRKAELEDKAAARKEVNHFLIYQSPACSTDPLTNLAGGGASQAEESQGCCESEAFLYCIYMPAIDRSL